MSVAERTRGGMGHRPLRRAAGSVSGTVALAAIASAAIVGAALSPGVAHAAGPDLACVKTRDPLSLRAMADLESQLAGMDPGCQVSRAKYLCTPATTKFYMATGGTLPTALRYDALQPGDQICYKVRCELPPATDVTVTDEFATRTLSLSQSKSSLLCAPAVEGSSYCGDGTIDAGEQCEAADLGGATCASVGYAGGTLACAPGCIFDESGCTPHDVLASCGNGTIDAGESCDRANLGGQSCATLGYLGGTLACKSWCVFDANGCVRTFPATGQTTCWDAAGGVTPCAGTGQDGDVQAGATHSYADNGDGTVTDDNTGLVWEKLSDDGSIHDKDNGYLWTDAFAVKLVALNTPPCFAGHCDWRLPNAFELMSLQNLQTLPAISPVFNTGCVPGCDILTCSCVNLSTYNSYWSSTTEYHPINGGQAMLLSFSGGDVGFAGKVHASNLFFVRAVRGGY